MSAELTLEEIERRIEAIRRNLSDHEVQHLITRWQQGRHIELPLSKVRNLLVKADVMEGYVKEAVSKLQKHLKSQLGGVEIFSIRSPERKYGTGKSQTALFIYEELKAMGIEARYITVSVPDVKQGWLREALWDCRHLRSAVIFIDEVDLLFSPDLSSDEQRKLVETFANAIIEYAETVSSKDPETRQALVLILSYLAEEKVRQEVWGRLGRRLMQELLSVSFRLDKSDMYKLLASVSAIFSVRYELSKDALWLVKSFAADYAEFLYSNFGRTAPVGELISLAMRFTQQFCRGLSSVIREQPSRLGEIEKNLKESARLGVKLEHVVKDSLRRLVPKLDIQLRAYGQKATCTLSEQELSIDGYRVDCYYVVSFGPMEVGRCLVEISAVQDLDYRKREQLEKFAKRYPTALIHLTDEEVSRERLKSAAEEAGFELITLPKKPFSYSAALMDFAESDARNLAYDIVQSIELRDAVTAFLARGAEIVASEWFAQKKVKEAEGAASHAEARRKIEEALEDSLRSFILRLDFQRSTKRRKTTVQDFFSKSIRGIKGDLTDDEVSNLLEEILGRWANNNLCRITAKEVHKADWSDERAIRIAYEFLASKILTV